MASLWSTHCSRCPSRHLPHPGVIHSLGARALAPSVGASARLAHREPRPKGITVGLWCARVPSKVCNGGANVAMDRQPLSKAQPCKDARAFGLLHPTAPKPHSIGVEIRGSVTRGKLYGAFRNIRSSEWCDGSTALRSNACSSILFRF